ncbi:MAG: DUF2306 domain-containing protein [Candidatus Nanopelagicales bacterium]
MSDGSWKQWRVTAGLLALSFVPMVAGAARLGQLASGAEVTAANQRFFDQPLPVVLHIVGATVFSLLGAFQFVPSLRRRRWHRIAGRVALPMGLVASLSGLWMTFFYAWPAGDELSLAVVRTVVGVGMTVSLVLALVAVRRRDFRAHRAWVTRGYALGLGAGTQVLTHLPWLATGHPPLGWPRTSAMAAGWAINLAVAEWAIRRNPTGAPRRAARPAREPLAA